MAQNFTRVAERGGIADEKFGACKKKFSQILKKIKISIVTVMADNSAPEGHYSYYRLQLLQIIVSKNEKRQGDNNM